MTGFRPFLHVNGTQMKVLKVFNVAGTPCSYERLNYSAEQHFCISGKQFVALNFRQNSEMLLM